MSVTFGGASAPSQVTLNLDSLFGLSLAAYSKTLVDNIGATNALLHEIISRELYEPQDGGTYIQDPLMYAFQTADTYDGYDELPSVPCDGVTDAIYQWRQCAAAVVYSMKEVKQNKQRLVNLVKTRIMQAEEGLKEFFAQQLMWGAASQGGALTSAYSSPVNGSLGVEPLFSIVDFNPSNTRTIGNIDQGANTWWRNKTKTSAATTYDGFLLEVDTIFNRTALGTGGRPKIILADETTYELFVHSLYQKYRYTEAKTDQAYPFENVMYKTCHVVMDDKVPDVKNSIVPTLVGGSADPTTLTNGTMALLNPQFFKMVHESDSDFAMLKDDSGKTMFKPVNGDSRLGHFAWMGNVIVNNRRKQGILAGIARTLTTP